MAAVPTAAAWTSDGSWTPWRVSPQSGFEVAAASGEVGLVQLDDTQFLVQTMFRYSDPKVLEELARKLQRWGMSQAAARRAVEDARTFTPNTENPTDLASIPPFARWFENTYGRHTLAAILHDNLIRSKVNDGPLGSDTLSDRFFREMLVSVGVPFLKRWVIWTAVALRSRFVAGGYRRFCVCVWGVSAAIGMGTFLHACLQRAGIAKPLRVGNRCYGPGKQVLFAAGLPFAAGLLWGRQYIASVFAAIAGVFILPAVLCALAGGLVYSVLERLFGAVGWVSARAAGQRRCSFVLERGGAAGSVLRRVASRPRARPLNSESAQDA